jgi:hypothetical protein
MLTIPVDNFTYEFVMEIEHGYALEDILKKDDDGIYYTQ